MNEAAVNLDVMRDDYRLVRNWWRVHDGWSDEELAEADAAVKAAVDGGDAGLIDCWAVWLAGIAAEKRAVSAEVRAFEARVKAEFKQKRDEAKA